MFKKLWKWIWSDEGFWIGFLLMAGAIAGIIWSLNQLGFTLSQKETQRQIVSLQSQDVNVRREAAEYFLSTLTRSNNDKTREFTQSIALEPLMGALKDNGIWVQCFAAQAVAQIGGPAVVKALNEALTDENPWMRYYASNALWRVGEIKDKPEDSFRSILFIDEFKRVIKGWSVDTLAPYGDGSPHPVIIVSQVNVHPWTLNLPVEWLPQTLHDTQLVAYIEDYWEKTGEMSYDSSGRSRLINPPGQHYRYFTVGQYQHHVEIVLREGRSGAVVGSVSFTGSRPDSLKAVEWEAHDEFGSEVPFGKIRNWLEQYVLKE